MGANWGKFTLMDSVTLVAAFALGIFLATHFVRTDTHGRFETRAQLTAEWAVSCVLWSGVIAGPMTLVVQRFRGRRVPPSPGECLWLAPLSLYLLGYASQILGEASIVLLLLCVSVQCVASIAAFFWLVAGLTGTRPAASCRWTDLLGCSVCMAVGPWILYGLNQALNQL
jgi:hypothetical protein